MKKWLLGIAAFLTVLAGGTQIDNLGGGGRTNEKERFVFNAVEVSTTSFPMSVNDFQLIAVAIAASSTTGTIKFACSNLDEVTNIVNAQGKFVTTSKNLASRWDYVEIVDLEDGASIDGDVGIAMVNLSDVRQFKINVDNFRHCMAELQQSAGTTTVTFLPSSNQ